MSKLERDEYIDIAKAICMLLIIGIHTEAYVAVGMPFTFVAVPMFFFMSGMYHRSGVELKGNLIKILKRLLWPAVVWLLIGALFNLLLNLISHQTEMSLSFDIYNPSKYNGPIWFLFALSYAKLFMWGLNKIGGGWWYSLSVIMGYIGSTFQLPLHIDEGLAAMPFYSAGAIIFPQLKRLTQNVWLTMVGIVVFVPFTSGLLSFIINPMGNGLYKPFYILPMLCVLGSFIPVLALSQKIRRISFIKNFGQNTLGILLVQLPLCMVFSRIAWRVFERESIGWYVLSAVFYVIIVILSYYIVVNIKRFCPIMFGIGNK